MPHLRIVRDKPAKKKKEVVWDACDLLVHELGAKELRRPPTPEERDKYLLKGRPRINKMGEI